MRKLFNQLLAYRQQIAQLYAKHNCQNISPRAAKWVAVAQSLRAKPPAALFVKTCLCASLLPFPVVKAWSVWNKKEDSDDEVTEKFAKTLRLKGKKDQQLIHDLFTADYMYKHEGPIVYKDVAVLLQEHSDKNEPEIQWRLARMMYEFSKKAGSTEEKADLLERAFELVTNAMEIDEGNFAVHKWKAILLNEVSVLKGLKEQIIQSVNVKKHITRAIELNPNDATCHYMLGNWCFSVAEVPWYQRKVAATIFATPPESTYAEALEHFLKAEKLNPGFYSMNHLMLARIYIQMNELSKAAKYLNYLENRKVMTDEDFRAKKEAMVLISKYYTSRTHFEEIVASMEEVA
ncbi:Regulator of microtubule dynamics protein 1 [Orchesella cincta]|uniref:Regulator of microtubule dynamics protein 1 n=1 Tax=Orchesella cincta TaxID=48709 RepID=A0A1D2NKR6_ORCCI|nr:Regulator of microtubule dynamics protein 1 [Orchesella cincta]